MIHSHRRAGCAALDRPVLLRRAIASLVCALCYLAFTNPVDARDPSNLAECRSTMTPLIEARCRALFTESSQQASCLQQVAPQVKQTCDQFFGEGQDF